MFDDNHENLPDNPILAAQEIYDRFFLFHGQVSEKQAILKHEGYLEALGLFKALVESTSLDRFWGLFVKAGVALGKFGKEAEPFVKLVKELTGIAWHTQAKSEGLSGNIPLTFTDDNKLED